MASTSVSTTIERIREEAAAFETKDRLLSFSQKNKFQSPLLLDNGDLFFETWQNESKPRTLAHFFPVSAKYNEERQTADLETFRKILKSKVEDFCNQDLYMATGFIKCGEKMLAPAILIPLTYDTEHDTLTISDCAPIENIALQSLDKNIKFPIASDFYKNKTFNIQKFFDTLEKKIAARTDWKFTRNGYCITFYSTNKILLKKKLTSECWTTAKAANNEFFIATIGNEGFLPQPSLFDEEPYDHVFNPAEHYFPYITDSQTNKAVIDALDEKYSAYAIQTLPGAEKAKAAVNIAAELIQQKKKVCVISRRAITKFNFENAWKPPFRSFQGPDRDTTKSTLSELRAKLVTYYDSVNFPLKPCGATLTELLDEITKLKTVKTKFASDLFKNIADVRYDKFKAIHSSLEEMTQLFFEQNGIEVYNAFQGITLPAVSKERKNLIGEELSRAKDLIETIKPFIESVVKSKLYLDGFNLSDILTLINVFKKNFDKDMPGLEDWNLHSNGWIAYQDDLNDLPSAGARWSSYRRKGSDIFLEDAIDVNIVAARNEFYDSLNSALKSLSDHYRRPKRILLSVFKNPKSITSDDMLIEQIDKLIEMQEYRRKYKDSSVLATRLFGKDWKYEKTDWNDLANKIRHYYVFRARIKNSDQHDYLMQLLAKWHLFKPFAENLDKIQASVEELQKALQSISKSLNLSESLESQNIDLWTDKIERWSTQWDKQDVYLQICEHIENINDSPCENLAQFVKDSKNASKDIAMAFARSWTNSQMQAATAECPELFSPSSKNRKQQGKQYRTLLDQFSNANFRAMHETVEKNPARLQIVTLSQSYHPDFESFDVALLLDADCMTIAEAMPGIFNSKKVILFGNPCEPTLEALPMDACNMEVSSQSIFFKDNVLSAALRKGIPTRVISYTMQYANPALFRFANNKIYNNEIAQFPNSTITTGKSQTLKVVHDKISAIAEKAIQHATKNPSQTLGIVASSQALCKEIEVALQNHLEKNPNVAKFFTQGTLQNKFYIKTIERAVDLYRDEILVCVDIDDVSNATESHKLAIGSTLAKQSLCLFLNNEESDKLTEKEGLFQEWVVSLKSKSTSENATATTNVIDTPFNKQIKEVLKAESIAFKDYIAPCNIPVGPVIVDANNSKRFLAVIESDCSYGLYNESIEDREYTRPNAFTRLGWKVLPMWLPLWNISNADEKENLIATIAIEQSVAPPPQEDLSIDDAEQNSDIQAEPYNVVHFAKEGSGDDLPFQEFPVDKLIEQLKFYVDSESPIHGELLLQRLLELHNVEHATPKISAVLSDAIKQALHQKQFVKTGPFFYSLKNKAIVLRDRTKRPDNERKMAYVPPEERALLKLDDHSIKQILGVL
ncbi:hypothetical protein SAMN05720759_10855 [Fibrobacter sp. UWB12]|nr:hypothetical protein SAMN05720759_10855 [Fibrobacter sp. UWB12]